MKEKKSVKQKNKGFHFALSLSRNTATRPKNLVYVVKLLAFLLYFILKHLLVELEEELFNKNILYSIGCLFEFSLG